MTRWWFQIFFVFTPIWGRFPIWLIVFRWVETTNQMKFPFGMAYFRGRFVGFRECNSSVVAYMWLFTDSTMAPVNHHKKPPLVRKYLFFACFSNHQTSKNPSLCKHNMSFFSHKKIREQWKTTACLPSYIGIIFHNPLNKDPYIVDGRNPAPPEKVQNLVSNGINYQPHLVNAWFLPSTVLTNQDSMEGLRVFCCSWLGW